jgi:CRP-like cAMP-binding protein
MLETKVPYLSSGNWMDALSDTVRFDIENRYTFLYYERGDLIYEQDSVADKIFHIIDGEVRISNYLQDGKEHVHIIFQRGEGFGDMEVLDNQARGTAAVANAKTKLGVLGKKDFFELREQHRELDSVLLLLYCHRLRNLLSWSEEANCLELSSRIAKRLHMLGNFYGKPSHDSGSALDIRVTQEDLAKMLGVARQSVGKELKEMEARGVLKIRYGKITLLDHQSLPGYSPRITHH